MSAPAQGQGYTASGQTLLPRHPSQDRGPAQGGPVHQRRHSSRAAILTCPSMQRKILPSRWRTGLPEVFRAFGWTGCQIRLIPAFFQKIRLAAIL